MGFQGLYNKLKNKIADSTASGVTLEEAETLAGEFLHAQLIVSEELKTVALDARMRKTGVKALKAAVYLEEATKTDKKPSDVMLSAMVDSNKLVQEEQNALDRAEVLSNELELVFDVFQQSHHYYKQISKGRFE